MNRYSLQPQGWFSVIGDGCCYFGRYFFCVVPLTLLLFVLYSWLSLSDEVIALAMVHTVGASPLALHDVLAYVHQLDWQKIHYIHALNYVLFSIFYLITLALLYTKLQAHIKGQRHGWHHVIKHCRPRFISYFLVSLITGCAAYFGLLILILPGILLYTLFYQARFYALFERMNFLRCLKESARLVWATGFWRTFFVVILAAVFYVSIAIGTVWCIHYAPHYLLLFTLIGALLRACLVVLIASVQLSLFHDLKLRWAMPS